MQFDVVHKYVNIVVFPINNYVILSSNERKTTTHFQQEIGYFLGQLNLYVMLGL